jgi:serine/threonine protein kinase
MIGQTISHYRIIGKLGEGGMGVVYLAEDTILGRQVAIKTLTDGGLGKQHFRTRFFREAVAVSSLSHSNIATIYDYGHSNGQPYIVMELVKGKTLADLIAEHSLSFERAVEIMIDVSLALAEAHRHGMVHRDIKPSNIAITDAGQAKVLDFGLAKQLEPNVSEPNNGNNQNLANTQTRECVIIGTPMYFSPEQAMGVTVDARSDLFSLGSVLYECVAGKPPFSGLSPMDVCAKVIRDDPPPPSAVNPLVPAELDHLILKSMAKKPEERYQSAEAWIQDLRSTIGALKSQSGIENGSAISADVSTQAIPRKPETVDQPKRFTIFTRQRPSAGTISFIAALVVIALVALYSNIRPSPYRPPPAAQESYEAGINSLHEGSYLKAIESFQKATAIDNNFAMAHGGLAAAYIELDYHESALKEALQATALVNSNNVSAEDALYLQAIKATILQSHDEAVTCFADRTRLLSSDKLNSGLLDLALAYEKKEDFLNAEQTYQRITNDAREFPLALLRLGVLASRNQNFDKARDYFYQSLELFQRRENNEGVTEVRYQRGSMLITAQSTVAAAEELEQGLDLARRVTRNKYQEIRMLLQLSSVAKEQGLVDKAKSLASQATEQASENDMPSLETQGLIQAGNVFMFNREYQPAKEYFVKAIASADRYKGLSSGAQAQLALGGLYVQQEENIDEGLRLIEGALAFYRKGGYSREWWRAMLWLGRAQIQRGNYERAHLALDELLGQIQKSGDILLIADTHFEKGILLANLEQYPQALQEFSESRDGYQQMNNHTKTGYAWLYCGEMLWRLGNYPQAVEAFAQAESKAPDKKALLVRIALTKTQMTLSEEKFSLAIQQGTQLRTLLGSQYKRTSIELRYTLGLAYGLAGSSQGLKECQDAAELATPYPDPRLWANALLALAEVKLTNGDAPGSLQNATQAAELFSKAKQWESYWRANVVASQASQRLNDYESARKYLLIANNTLTNLRSMWGDEAFENYSQRSDVGRYTRLLHKAPDVAR